MVDMQSATAENRRGKRQEKKKKEERNQLQNIMAFPIVTTVV